MSSTSKTVTLRSYDGEDFDVDVAVALQSRTIKRMMEDNRADDNLVIPLPKVTSKILAKVIEYCKKHVNTPRPGDRKTEEELKSWDAEFVKVDQDTLYDIFLAAHYLNIRDLGDLTLLRYIWGQIIGEFWKTFNMKNDSSCWDRARSLSKCLGWIASGLAVPMFFFFLLKVLLFVVAYFVV